MACTNHSLSTVPRWKLQFELALTASFCYTHQGSRHTAVNRRQAMKQARLQSLEIDPSTQFCSDPEDCMRNNDYFLDVSSVDNNRHMIIIGIRIEIFFYLDLSN